MLKELKYEKRFIATVAQFESSFQDLSVMLNQLEHWRSDLSEELAQHKINDAQLNKNSPLAQQIQSAHTAIETHIDRCVEQWEALKPAQDFADTFDDKLILLVYGKFNAGKSSFCNFIAERFKTHEYSVQYFRLDAGRILVSKNAFEEGVTETTAQLQGVVLADKLVLVDTPGLHSATQENSELTKSFTDSADGVLWLSSSASPGQVQELDELGRELSRRKPLLPIITRSDYIEEDEVDGEIKKVLCNKTLENRQLQEHDVKTRAQDKLRQMRVVVSQLKTPLSISVRTAQKQGASSLAMIEAGFERLYETLLELIAPAMLYKRRKSVEMLLHHLEENVIDGLLTEVLPLLENLIGALDAEASGLEQKAEQLINSVWREVIPLVPALVDKHEKANDVQAVCNELKQQLHMALEQQIKIKLSSYLIELNSATLQLQVPEGVGYEQVVVEQVVVGISQDALHTALEKAIYLQLKAQASELMAQCEVIIETLSNEVEAIRELLVVHAEKLNNIKINNSDC